MEKLLGQGGMLEILTSLAKFALICAALGAVLGAAYVLTRHLAARASASEDDSPGAAFFLWLHPDLCGDDAADTTSIDASDGGAADD